MRLHDRQVRSQRLNGCLIAVSALLVASCARGDPLAPLKGVYTLRSLVSASVQTLVPGAIPNGWLGTDSAGYLAGAFELGPGRTWRLQLRQYFVTNGVRRELPPSDTRGRYLVLRRSRDGVVLDLYNGQPTIALATLVTTALIRHDTLSYGFLRFAR